MSKRGYGTPGGWAVLVFVILLVVITACADQTQSQKQTLNVGGYLPGEQRAWTGKTDDLAHRALKVAPADFGRWRYAVVLATNGKDGWKWEAIVLDRYGYENLEVSGSSKCKGGPNPNLLLDPGDLITWSLRGDDVKVCGDEFHLIEKSVVP